MKCLSLVLLSLFVLISLQLVHTSLVPPIDDHHQLLKSVQLAQAAASIDPSRLFVFLCPPASFVHHQITVALELHRRGHQIIFATLPGFQKHLDNQLKLFEIDNSHIKAPPIEVLEVAGAIQFDIGGKIDHITRTKPDERQTDVGRTAMRMYENSFANVTTGIDQIRSSADWPNPEEKRVQELVFSQGALVIIPGPWATPINYCRLHGLKYIIMLPSPTFASIFSEPPFLPRGPDHGKNFGKSLLFRWKLLWKTVFPEGDSFDTKPATHYPTLRLVQSIPALTHLRSYSPLTVFTGPLVSKERRDPRHLSDGILTLLENDGRLPVIYLSMGSYAKLGSEQIEKLADAFLPFDRKWGIIWALSKSQQEAMSNSTKASIERLQGLVVIEDWIQSPAVLSHSNTLLFVSHCGANGLSEGVVTGTPVLGLPLFGDQPANCETAEENLQMVLCRSLYDTPTLELRRLASDIVLNKKHKIHEYAYRAKTIASKGYHGAETAADWIETASSLKGDFSFLATPPEREGVIRSFCLDIIAVMAITVVVACCTLSWCIGIRQGRNAQAILSKQKTSKKKNVRGKVLV